MTSCGKAARHGAPCNLDADHVLRGERHSNGEFTWALRGKEAKMATSAPHPTMDRRVKLWDAINDYATACGGNPSVRVYGNTPRQKAVAQVERAAFGAPGSITVEIDATVIASVDRYLQTDWKKVDPSKLGAVNAVAYLGEVLVGLVQAARAPRRS